ncbi:MAG: RNA pseudouridine synthase [Mariniblastus sp.]|nr:RNA pseudouridine synthase [Mariniblastus sp.]
MSNLKVIFEDNHLLVVDKPPMLATMGAKAGVDSLHHQAQEYLRKKFNKPGNVYVGVVSRLDSFVSGVVVLARTSKAASRLSQQFRDGSVEKKYWAIVPNNLPDSGKLVDQLFKNESRHRMEVLPDSSKKLTGVKEARLRYHTLHRSGSVCLIEVTLETGRKHQIRVQLENIGCPIVGDKKYGSGIPFKRGIALHSRRISIQHPTKKVLQSFESEPPACWNLGRFG